MQQLTDEEREALEKRYSEGYKFITRDKNSDLYTYDNKPKKGVTDWHDESGDFYDWLSDDSEEIFDFIKWEDDEPYEIEKLLEGEEWGE